jgi:hypothetical protein
LSEPIAALDAVHMGYVTQQRPITTTPPAWGALPKPVHGALREVQRVLVAELATQMHGYDSLYNTRTVYHMQRADAANQEIVEAEHYTGTGQAGQYASVEVLPATTGLKRYLDYAERHLTRFADWVLHAPRDYVEQLHRRVCKRRQEHIKEHVPERNIQAQKSKLMSRQREREIEQ